MAFFSQSEYEHIKVDNQRYVQGYLRALLSKLVVTGNPAY